MTKLAESKYVWWFFAAAIVFVYFFGLGIPLVGPDEPRYAQVAREMFERGDWITPTLGGYEWFEKPALLYWLQIVSYHIFGVNEFAARFGSALLGLGTISSMWLLGRHSNFDADRNKSIEFANWLALITATMLGILVFSRGASFDIIVTFPLTASMAGFFIADRARPDESRKLTVSLAVFYFFAGLAVLAKGLIGVVFPFGIAAFYFLVSRRLPSRRFLLSLIWGVPLLAIVTACWNLPMYLTHGWKFIDEFYIQHHFQRYTSNKYRHPQPFYFYFWVLPLMTLPWLPLFLGGLIRSLRSLFRSQDPTTDKGEYAVNVFAIAWIGVPLLFFSASGSKLPGYILPAVPATAILTGTCLFGFVRRRRVLRPIALSIAGAILLLVTMALILVVPRYAGADSVKRLISTADSMGFAESRVAGFRTVSHNAEFYAAGRLIRDEHGRQKRFDDIEELGRFVSGSERPILVLVPLKHAEELRDIDCLNVETLADNSDLQVLALDRASVSCG